MQEAAVLTEMPLTTFRNAFTSGRHAPRVQAPRDADGWGPPLHEALATPGQSFGLCSRDVGDPGGPWCVSHCAVVYRYLDLIVDHLRDCSLVA